MLVRAGRLTHRTWPSQDVATRWFATGLKCRLLTESAGGELTSRSLFGLAGAGVAAANPVPNPPPKVAMAVQGPKALTACFQEGPALSCAIAG